MVAAMPYHWLIKVLQRWHSAGERQRVDKLILKTRWFQILKLLQHQQTKMENAHSNDEWKIVLAKIWVSGFAHRRNSKCKGSEARASLVFLGNREKTSVAKKEQATRKRKDWQEIRMKMETRTWKGELTNLARGFDFMLSAMRRHWQQGMLK